MKVAWYMNPLYPALALLIARVCYTIIIALKNRYPASPLLAPLATAILGVLIFSSLYANFQRVHAEPEKLPIHIFTDYLQSIQDEPYRLVIYDLHIQELDYADSYYLDRVPEDRIIRTRIFRPLNSLLTSIFPSLSCSNALIIRRILCSGIISITTRWLRSMQMSSIRPK